MKKKDDQVIHTGTYTILFYNGSAYYIGKTLHVLLKLDSNNNKYAIILFTPLNSRNFSNPLNIDTFGIRKHDWDGL